MCNSKYCIQQNTILIAKSSFNGILAENGDELQFLSDSRLSGMQIIVKPDRTQSRVLFFQDIKESILKMAIGALVLCLGSSFQMKQ